MLTPGVALLTYKVRPFYRAKWSSNATPTVHTPTVSGSLILNKSYQWILRNGISVHLKNILFLILKEICVQFKVHIIQRQYRVASDTNSSTNT